MAAQKGDKAALAAGARRPPNLAAAAQQIKPAAGDATSLKAAQEAPRAVPQPAQPAPALPAQMPQSRQTGPPAGKPSAGSAEIQGSAGGHQEKSGPGGGSGKADGASGASHKGGGFGNNLGNAPEQLQKKYVSENFAYILKIIQDHIVYPKKARREGLTGKAFVSFDILESGQVANIRLLRSTGYEILDVNLVKTIKDVAPFPKPPKKAELQMTLSYRLEQ